MKPPEIKFRQNWFIISSDREQVQYVYEFDDLDIATAIAETMQRNERFKNVIRLAVAMNTAVNQ